MKKIVEQWCKEKPFTDEEKQIFWKPENPSDFNDVSDVNEYIKMKNEFIKRLPFSQLSQDNCEITFDVSETSLINKVKEEFVDNNTLIITSDQEHPSVTDMVKSCPNYYIMQYLTEIISLDYSKLMDKIKNFEKIVVIINGVKVCSGEFTPQLFFIRLKELLKNKQSIIILDDAQGIFLHSRDYSIYDYVFGTCHAVVDSYDAGICFSIGSNKPLGNKAYKVGLNYLAGLDKVLCRMDKMGIFSSIMEDYFYNRILEKKLFNIDNSLHTTTVPYLFNLEDKNKIFTEEQSNLLIEKYKIAVDGIGTSRQMLRFRAQQYLDQPELLLKGLSIIDDILDNN